MIPPNTIFIATPPKVEYFVHVNKASGKIIGLSQQRYNVDDVEDLLVDDATAKDFLRGVKRTAHWVGIKQKDKFVLVHKKSLASAKYQRVEALRMQELGRFENDTEDSDIVVELGSRSDSVLIHYAIDKIDGWKEPVKLYFTAKGNPQILKCAFSLDVNIVEQIVESNKLDTWPNPIVLKLPDCDDIAVYIARSNIKMSIIRHETSNN